MIPNSAPELGTVAAAALLLLALAACGSEEGGAEGAAGPVVLATTTIWADVVSNVACGGDVVVESLVPAGSDPHAFEPSLRDRETLDGAALIVTNGLDLEATMADTIDAATDGGVPVFAVGEHVDTIQRGDGADPHIWFDPTLVAAALPDLADALIAAGAGAEQTGACVEDYAAELRALDAEIETALAGVPPARRVLVTNHDSLGYFAARYGFDILGTVLPSGSTLAEASPADLEDLADLIETDGLPAIFADQSSSTNDADALADRLGVDVVALHTDNLGEEAGVDSYVELLRTDAELVADALGG